MNKKITYKKLRKKKNPSQLLIKIINEDYIFLPLKDLVLRHFKNLGEDVGDSLYNIETLYSNFNSMIKENYKITEQKTSTEKNMDKLAYNLDNILNNHKSSIISDFLQAIRDN